MGKLMRQRGFTLIELLVVIGIIGLLASLALPAMSRARAQGKRTVCKSRLRNIGQGLVLYANENDDLLVPGRMPKVNDSEWSVPIEGGVKYRPTFLAMMATQLGMKPFDDPQPRRSAIDEFDQPGDRQNYANELYVCPEAATWVDERNGAYGYNYQFLGNARLRDPTNVKSYKNWPVRFSRVKSPEECVAVADCTGTAASYRPVERTSLHGRVPGYSRDTGRSALAGEHRGGVPR